jgi:hypothetical protein
LIGDSLVSFFGGKLAAPPFGTFATISARSGRPKERQLDQGKMRCSLHYLAKGGRHVSN